MTLRRSVEKIPVPLAAMLLSALSSLWIIATKPVLNDDAYSYLRAAELLSSDGLGAVLDQYGWYLYSVVIALFDYLVPGGLITSAHVFNTLSYMLLTWSFITLCRELYPDRPETALVAAIVILAFPLINEMRDFIIRDPAYWALSMTALLCLVRFTREAGPASAIGWTGCTLLAVAFRLEALLPTLLAPACLLFINAPLESRLRKLLQLGGILLIAIGGICILTLLLNINLLELMQFAYRYYLPRLLDFGAHVHSSALTMNQAIFTEDFFPGWNNTGLGIVILCFANTVVVIANIALALSLPVSALLLYSLCRRHCRFESGGSSAVFIYLACAFASLLMFQFIMHFQTQRYAALLCLLLLLFMPGLIMRFRDACLRRQRQRRFAWVAGLACLYFFTDSLVSFGHSRQYIIEASDYVRETVEPGALLGSNVRTIAYDSGLVDDYDQVSDAADAVIAAADELDYLAVALRAGDTANRQALANNDALELLAEFANARGDAVLVYRRRAL